MGAKMHQMTLEDRIDYLESKLFDEAHESEIGRMYIDVTNYVASSLAMAEIEDMTLVEIKALVRDSLEKINETDNLVLNGQLNSYRG